MRRSLTSLGPRIAVVGVTAAGKSTLVHRLKEKLALPVYHTDGYIWRDGWKNGKTNDQIVAYVDEVLQKPEWLLEGYLGYVDTPDTRLRHATTVIVLDYGRFRLAWQFLKRKYTHHGKSRPELPPECQETFSLKAIRKSLNLIFVKDIRKNLYDWIAQVPADNILIFKNPRQLRVWLRTNGLL